MELQNAILQLKPKFVKRIELRDTIAQLDKSCIFSNDCLTFIMMFLPDRRSITGYNDKILKQPRTISLEQFNKSSIPPGEIRVASTPYAQVYSNGNELSCITSTIPEPSRHSAEEHIVLTFGNTIYVINDHSSEIIEIRQKIRRLKPPTFGVFIFPPLPCGLLLIHMYNGEGRYLYNPRSHILVHLNMVVHNGSVFNDFGILIDKHTDMTLPAYQSPAAIE